MFIRNRKLVKGRKMTMYKCKNCGLEFENKSSLLKCVKCGKSICEECGWTEFSNVVKDDSFKVCKKCANLDKLDNSDIKEVKVVLSMIDDANVLMKMKSRMR